MEQYSTSDAIQEAYLRHVDERIIESLESRAMHYSARTRVLRLVERVSLLPTAVSAFFAGTGVFSGDYRQAIFAGAFAVVSVVTGIASRYFAEGDEWKAEFNFDMAEVEKRRLENRI